MRIVLCEVLLSVFVLSCICHAGSLPGEASDGAPAVEKKYSSTYDRVQAAAERGDIKLKDAVILQAQLMFASDSIPKSSLYSPLPGEKLVEEECGTGFYKQVHQVFPELKKGEKELLKSLSPDLKSIIETREKEIR